MGVAGDNKTSRDSEEIVDLRRTVSVLRLFSLYCTVCRKRPEFYSKPDHPKNAAKEIAYHGDGELFLFCVRPQILHSVMRCSRRAATERSDLIDKYF